MIENNKADRKSDTRREYRILAKGKKGSLDANSGEQAKAEHGRAMYHQRHSAVQECSRCQQADSGAIAWSRRFRRTRVLFLLSLNLGQALSRGMTRYSCKRPRRFL